MPPDPGVFLPLRSDVLHILLALSRGAIHGYGIILEVERRSQGEIRLQTGALYRFLKRLTGQGLIEECERPRDEASTDERRRYYRLTRLGTAVVHAEVERIDRLVRVARATGVGRKPRLA